ncbi:MULTISPECIES: DUF4142 domain-containing protein [Acetobacter]|jgi:predicted outer membrane protein|uniref:DUF4142 domain-containing protein n=1 Tax=Acetobacter TaxID=434 RepID=UPI0020A02FDE|nr:DUF4142 domain-containing protein [Acetobacter lovaniensis]MCI1698679.1 DUF4142 domain-containing protein [Acetobacter lovaniensis]MCI1795755.1 DUF4142 domain-containing protein [Acetobacter lovaniensis]MCP1240446.1 DUF4142 domain-containing protein [Acetobacter lovaniensis]
MLFLFRHKVVALSLFTLLLLGGCGYVTPARPVVPPLPALAKPAPFSAADAVFVQKLNTMDLAQIGMATIARTHAARNDIALVGESISKDMSALQARLAKVATAHGLTLPARPSGSEQKQIERLQRWQGAAFDRHYIRYFTAAHARIKPVLASQIAFSKNPDLVAIARDVQTRLADYQAVMR